MQERDQRQQTRIIKCDRSATLPQIAADFIAWPSISITVQTIQQNIIDMGFRSLRRTRVPMLTARHKRLAWSRFQLNRADGRVRVWKQPHESVDPTYQQMTVQAGRSSVMGWDVRS
ncbi:HTH_Tnp_Tc3_2 domain-containing protein [Trichonephila clavipes]|nr:HTH_Tnp_Tc3_2 domain-containing protein [Trichonephila clavipes]